MAEYRVYCMDRNRVTAANVAECDSGGVARDKAKTLLSECGHTAAEVWQGARRVCHIDRGYVIGCAAPNHASEKRLAQILPDGS